MRIHSVSAAVLTGLLVAAARVTAAEPLPISTNIQFTSGGPEATFTIDLGTLPDRPWLIVEATPDAAHQDMQLQIEATNWQSPTGHPGDICPSPTQSLFSPNGSGAAKFSFSLNNCDPRIGAFVGHSATILVRPITFGSAGAPATVSIVIRGETHPPTATLSQQVDTALTLREISFVAWKDTVIYQEFPDRSNGQGDFLWAGQRNTDLFTSYPRNSLIAFDLDGSIPPSAIVNYAQLSLQVSSISPLSSSPRLVIQAIAPGTWDEGDANAPGSEFTGAASLSPAADWEFRSRPLDPWATPGGETIGGPVVDTLITVPNVWYFDSPVLRAAVRDMVSDPSGEDGFVLSNPDPAPTTSEGIQFSSSENSSGGYPPTLFIQYTPTQPFESGAINAGTVNFINEGQNFRWIYDLDHDDVFITSIGGVCEVLDTSAPLSLPYSYSYGGTPGFTGIDCCTWKIDSPQTGTVGTGQALFFHNLDASNPANMPPDSDQDGIRNLCDNCPSTPNGPLLGTCRTGPSIGALCHSTQQCGGGVCDLAQEDTDGNFQGNACPEPGLGTGLSIGLGLLVALTRRHRTAC